jgi:glycosyltransferase involved in cell wall biosynthesis
MTLYCVFFDWPNTTGNHAGMAYFACVLKNRIKTPVNLIKVPNSIGKWNWRFQRLWQLAVIYWFKIILKNNDVLFLMEYLGGRQCGDHRAIAIELRKRGIHNRMVGIVHLAPQSLDKLYEREYITSGLAALDDIIVFGTSLEEYFANLGFKQKVRRTFHYVDTDYYLPLSKPAKRQFTVIASGSLLRNHQVLHEIVAACPDLHFNICMGKADLRNQFTGTSNISLFPYLPEEKLLRLMQESDASLSAFDDTVGSNVIVTSMACGLPQVVSDVGSIRDYCSEENSLFCKSMEDYVNALQELKNHVEIRIKMGISARHQSEQFSLSRSIQAIEEIILNPG